MTMPVSITTSLGNNDLLFRSMSGRETLGRMFEYSVELLSKNASLDLSELVGQPMTVQLQLPKGQRYFNGVVRRVSLVGGAGRFAVYRATLRPWMWQLRLRSGCRIFQNLSVPEIIKNIFLEHGFADFSDALVRTYNERDFIVQYRETDFDFVSRWMEREGIYYFFRHDRDRHTLVLADDYCAHETTANYEKVPYYPKHETGRRERDHIDCWSVSHELTPSASVIDDYDFTHPRADLMAKLVLRHDFGRAAREMYDYPGAFTNLAQGETYARIRLEEYNAEQELIHAEGNARGLTPGTFFSLSNHSRADQNREYLLVSATYDIRELDCESTAEPKGEHVFRCSLSSIPSTVPFRSRSITPKSRVHGAQTAVVVGKSGEDIWTDQYGRVKLRFRWDREGKPGENASCWVRVAQASAGAGWGVVHIPRIGDEVIVEFLEGDPDRPIVTGRVYNAYNEPPYELPMNQTQSGIRSKSSPEGTYDSFNELRFEDQRGEEQVYLQAQRNFDTYVKNDETHVVDHNRTKSVRNSETTTIGGTRSETVGADEMITVKGARTGVVEGDETLTINGAHAETVGGDETLTVKGTRTETVEGDETLAVNGAHTVKVATNETITIDGGRTETVASDESITINGARTTTVASSDATTVNGGRCHSVAGNDEYAISGKFVVNAGQGLELKVGGGSIGIDPAGNVTIKGLMVRVKGSGMVDVNASGILSLFGSMVRTQ